jgi:hypothetical protein
MEPLQNLRLPAFMELERSGCQDALKGVRHLERKVIFIRLIALKFLRPLERAFNFNMYQDASKASDTLNETLIFHLTNSITNRTSE